MGGKTTNYIMIGVAIMAALAFFFNKKKGSSISQRPSIEEVIGKPETRIDPPIQHAKEMIPEPPKRIESPNLPKGTEPGTDYITKEAIPELPKKIVNPNLPDNVEPKPPEEQASALPEPRKRIENPRMPGGEGEAHDLANLDDKRLPEVDSLGEDSRRFLAEVEESMPKVPEQGHVEKVIGKPDHSLDGHTKGSSSSLDLKPKRKPAPLKWEYSEQSFTSTPMSDDSIEAIAKNIFREDNSLIFTNYDSVLGETSSLLSGAKSYPKLPYNDSSEFKIGFNKVNFCENFNHLQAGFEPEFPIRDEKRREYWESGAGKETLNQLNQITKLRNKIVRKYRTAENRGDKKTMTSADQEHQAFWKIYYSCAGYAKSGEEWTKENPASWQEPKDGGVYGLNDLDWKHESEFDVLGVGAVGICSKAWNKSGNSPQIDNAKVLQDEYYRKKLLTRVDQGFNTFCAVTLDNRKMASQLSEKDSCVNPFSVDSAPSLSFLHKVKSRNQFLSCTQKLLTNPASAQDLPKVVSNLRNGFTGGSASRALASEKHGI